MAAASSESALLGMQLTVRHHEGTSVYELTESSSSKCSLSDGGSPLAAAESVAYSPDGRWLALATASEVLIVDSVSRETVTAIPQAKVQAMHFSPRGTYLLTWHKPSDDEENLVVWTAQGGDKVGAFKQKHLSTEVWPSLQWTPDEAFVTRAANGRLGFYPAAGFVPSAPDTVMTIPAFAGYSIGPGAAPYTIAIARRPAKGKPGCVALYRYPNLKLPQAIAARSVMKVDGSTYHWAPDGTALLAHVMSDSGDSYYGDTSLVLLAADGAAAAEISPGQALHDVAWCPDSKRFVVIAGNSPPKCTMHSRTGKPIFSFGNLYRNTVKWAPCGRFLALGGFAGMAGGVDFWDVKTERRLGSTKIDMVNDCAFSPDGKWFLVNTEYHRMKTDNKARVYTHYGEGPVAILEFPRLHSASWRPALPGTFPEPEPAVEGIPAAEVSTTTATAKYRPRGAAGSTAASSGLGSTSSAAGKISAGRYIPASQRSGPPGSGGGPVGGRAGGGRRKKRGGGGASAPSPAPAPAEPRPDDPADMTPEQAAKEKRKIEKKLRQVAAIEERQAAGEELDDAQKAKLAGKPQLVQALAALVVML